MSSTAIIACIGGAYLYTSGPLWLFVIALPFLIHDICDAKEV